MGSDSLQLLKDAADSPENQCVNPPSSSGLSPTSQPRRERPQCNEEALPENQARKRTLDAVPIELGKESSEPSSTQRRAEETLAIAAEAEGDAFRGLSSPVAVASPETPRPMQTSLPSTLKKSMDSHETIDRMINQSSGELHERVVDVDDQNDTEQTAPAVPAGVENITIGAGIVEDLSHISDETDRPTTMPEK